MARLEVLAERTCPEEYEADIQAHTEDMADERGSGQDYTDKRVELCEGFDTSGRVHVHHDGPGDIGGEGMCRAAVGWHGAVQSVVERVCGY